MPIDLSSIRQSCEKIWEDLGLTKEAAQRAKERKNNPCKPSSPKSAALQVMVLNEDGSPFTGKATVKVAKSSRSTGSKSSTTCTQVSPAKGEAGLERTIDVTSKDYEPVQEKVTLRPGETRLVEIRLRHVPAGHLIVTIRGKDDELFEGVHITVAGALAKKTLNTRKDGTATFQWLPPGAYRITVNADGFYEKTYDTMVSDHKTTKANLFVKGPYIAADPASYMGTSVGSGECAIFGEKAAQAPHTRYWRRGIKVQGHEAEIAPGTAVATFDDNQHYGNHPSSQKLNADQHRSHTAIYKGQDKELISVWEQWNHYKYNAETKKTEYVGPENVREKDYYFSTPEDPKTEINDGGNYYVIE